MPKSRSARFYASHPESRAKKAAYDTRLNDRPAQVNKREQANKMRARAKRAGQNVRGKDYDHGSRRFISSSANRGKTSGTKGDRNARGRHHVRFGRSLS